MRITSPQLGTQQHARPPFFSVGIPLANLSGAAMLATLGHSAWLDRRGPPGHTPKLELSGWTLAVLSAEVRYG